MTISTGDAGLLRKHLRRLELTRGNVDEVDEVGMTALHWAVLRGHEICVRLLLDYGADPDYLQTGGNTALLIAAAKGYDTIARLLLERGANISAKNRQSCDAVHMAISHAHASKGLLWMFQLFTSRGLNINRIDIHGLSPLHLCAEKSVHRPIELLVGAGGDVNLLHGLTHLAPLHMACSRSRPDIETIRSLLQSGAFTNLRDQKRRTPLEVLVLNHPVKFMGYSVMEDDEGSSSPDDSSPPSSKWRSMKETLDQVHPRSLQSSVLMFE